MKNLTPTDSSRRTLVQYAIGFLSSIALTITAYAVVINRELLESWSTAAIALVLSLLAALQLLVQLMFFMHLGEESRPRWKLLTFIFAFIILGVIVFGSLWIMFDLNSRMMMSPTEMIKYMNRQSGL